MAKRRAGPRPARRTSVTAPSRQSRRPIPSRPTPVAESGPEGAKAATPAHLEAVALYEQGLAAVQAHQFARASSTLRAVISRFPAERDLHERIRLYLNICDRHMAPRAASPSTSEERVFAATLAVNAGELHAALDHLRTATAESPKHDHALYMLASVLVLLGKVDDAIAPLIRAIDLNPDNRSMARQDPDLEPLRQNDSVRAVLGGPTPGKADRRKAPRRPR